MLTKKIHGLFLSMTFLNLAVHVVAQIPDQPVWGIECLKEEAFYRDAVEGNSYFPDTLLTVEIEDVEVEYCAPNGLDSLDLFGPSIPYYDPVTNQYMEDVERKPMTRAIHREVTFTNTNTGLTFLAEQEIVAVEMLPYSTDSLAQPYVNLGFVDSIDYAAISVAIRDHSGEPSDFTDSCGYEFTIDSFNEGGRPAIIDIYPWINGGSRVMMFWRCTGSGAIGTKWYIQHVFVNGAPYINACVPPNQDTLFVNGCSVDTTPPTLAGSNAYSYGCSSIPNPGAPIVIDDFDSGPTISNMWNELAGGPCGGVIWQTVQVADGCGNTAGYQIAHYFDNATLIEFAPPPVDMEVPADAILPSPYDLPIASTCTGGGGAYVNSATVSYSGDSVSVQVIGIATCSGNAAYGSYTLNATSVNFFSELEAFVSVPIEEGLPVPVDLDSINENNPFYYFTLTVDTSFFTFRESGDVCPVYTVERTYRTYNDDDEPLDDLVFIQTLEVYDETPPVISIGENISVETGSEVPEVEYTTFDNYGIESEEYSEVVVLGSCEVNYTLVRTVTAVDSCGNVGSAVQEVFVDGDCGTVGMHALQLFEELHLFPNPTKGGFTVICEDFPVRYTIEDPQGRIAQTGTLFSSSSKLDLSGGAGLYVLRVHTKDKVLRRSIVVTERMR